MPCTCAETCHSDFAQMSTSQIVPIIMAGQLPGNTVFPGGATAGAGRGGGNSERKACFVKPVKLKIEIFLFPFFFLAVGRMLSKYIQKLPLKCKKHNTKLTRMRQLLSPHLH